MASKSRAAETAALMLCVMFFGTLNNFLGRMKAKVFDTYNFVSGITDNWLHLVINLLAIWLLMRAGSVTKEQLRYVFKFGCSWKENGIWKYIAVASVNDVANLVTGLAAQPYLTALMMSMMDQATTPFTVVCSFLMLGTRYSALETTCVVVLVAAAISGVLAAQASNSGDNSPFWAAFAALTTAFAAVSFVLKETAFREYSAYRSSSAATDDQYVEIGPVRHAPAPVPGPAILEPEAPLAAPRPGQPELPETLSVFLVGAIVSVGGCLMSVPVVLINRWLTADGSPTQALVDGFACMFNCEHALMTYFFYTINNFIYNFCLLALTSRGSALLAFLSLKLVVPLTAVCSSIPWPLIGAKTVGSVQWLILIVMLVALGGFRYGNVVRERLISEGRKHGCCYPLCG